MAKPIKVTSYMMRGNGATVTFNDNTNVEILFGLNPSDIITDATDDKKAIIVAYLAAQQPINYDPRLAGSYSGTTGVGGGGSGAGFTLTGLWDASTNSPFLVSSVGIDGTAYKVSVAGTTNLDGNANWDVGDVVYFSNGTWNVLQASLDINDIAGLQTTLNTLFNISVVQTLTTGQTVNQFELKQVAIGGSNVILRAVIASTTGALATQANIATELATTRWNLVSQDKEVIFPANTAVPQNFRITQDGNIYIRNTTGITGATFIADVANWTQITASSVAPTTITKAAHGFVVGDWLAIDSSTYVKARADNALTSDVVARVASVVDVNTFTINKTGDYITGLVGLTVGPYYLSDSVAGGMTPTAPAINGLVSKPIFVADSATSGYVLILRGAVVNTTLTSPVVVNSEIDFVTSEPAAPISGDIYIASTTGVGSVTGQAFVTGNIYRWLGGPTWEMTVPSEGWIAYYENLDLIYTYDGAVWSTLTAAAAAVISPDTNTFVQAVDGQVNFVVNGVPVGNVTEVAGFPKWTLLGGLDPVYYAGTPQTIVQRNALVATSPLTKAGYLVYVVDTGINEYQVWSGTAWKTVGSVDLNTTVDNQSGTTYDNGIPLNAPVTCDAGDLHIQINSDVTAYFTATASNTWPAVAQVIVARDLTSFAAAITAANDATGAGGVATTAARSDHKHIAQGVSADANNILTVGSDGLHHLPLDPTGFVGNLAVTDDTLQKVADKFDAYDPNTKTIAQWAASTAYKAGDLAITAMGAIVQSNSDRTSSVSFGTVEASNWTLISATSSLSYPWVANTYAYSGQLNNVNNQVVARAGAGLTGATFDAAEAASWNLISQVSTYISFTAGAVYLRGTQMLLNSVLYERISTGLAGATFDTAEKTNWRILATSDAIWQVTVDDVQTSVGEAWLVQSGHNVKMPVSPANGASVMFAPQIEWSTLNATFETVGATTVAAGQIGILAGYDIVTAIYDSTADNWFFRLGGAVQPNLAFDTLASLPTPTTVKIGTIVSVTNDPIPLNNGAYSAIGDVAGNFAKAWSK